MKTKHITIRLTETEATMLGWWAGCIETVGSTPSRKITKKTRKTVGRACDKIFEEIQRRKSPML